MRTVAWQGLTLDIEREPGAVKRLRDGREVVQVYPYGSIAGTQGVDEEAVDVLLGPTLTAPWVYVVHQHLDGEHDEDKALIGWQSADDARRAYERQYTPEMFGGMTVLSVEDFKARLANRKRRPGKVAFGAMGATTMAYIVESDENGRCGHSHATLADAVKCQKKLQRTQPSATILHEDGSPLTWPERDQLRSLFSAARHAFTVNAFSFAADMGPSDGPWHQIAKFGTYAKDGATSEFTAATLGQIVDNFARRQNLLSMDAEHQALNAPMNGQPAPPLAYYDALALVEGGKVTKFAARGEVAQPAGLGDGLWAHRAEVTPLGAELLPNYRYISPAFVVDGADEQGNPIGYDLLNIAATSIPFLDGMEPMTFYALPGERREGVTSMATHPFNTPAGFAELKRRLDALKEKARRAPTWADVQPDADAILNDARGASAESDVRDLVRQLEGKMRRPLRADGTRFSDIDASNPAPQSMATGTEYITLPSGGMVRPLLDPVEVDGRPAIIVGMEPGRPDMVQVQFQGERGRDAYPLARIRKVGMSAGSGAMKMASVSAADVKEGSVIEDANGAFGPPNRNYRVAAVDAGGVTLSTGLRLSWDQLGRATAINYSAAPRTGFAQRMASAADEAAVDRAWEEYQRATNAAMGAQDPEAHKRQAVMADKFADVAARAGYEQDAAAARSDAQRARELAARVDDLRKNPVVLKPGVIGPYMSAAPVGGTNGGSMNPDLMRRMGFADGGQPTVAEKCARYGAHCMGAATPDEITAMAADLEAHAEPEAKAMAAKMRRFAEAIAPHAEPDGDEPIIMDVDPSNLAQNAAVHLKTGNVHDEGGRKHSRMSQAFATLAGRLGLDPRKTSRHAVLMAATAGMVPIAEIGPMVDAQVAARLEADRRAAEARAAEQAAASLAEQAIAGGYPHGQREALVAFARTNAAAARTLVAPYLAGDAALMTRTSRGGTPAGAAVPTRMSAADDVQIVQRGTVQIARTGNALAREARAYRASTGASYEEALEHLRKTRPDLIAANFNG